MSGKTDVSVVVVKSTVAFLSLYFLWGTLNTGAGRPAVSPQALGRFHWTQFKINQKDFSFLFIFLFLKHFKTRGGEKKHLSTELLHIQGQYVIVLFQQHAKRFKWTPKSCSASGVRNAWFMIMSGHRKESRVWLNSSSFFQKTDYTAE